MAEGKGEDFVPTQDELNSIKKAMQDPKFRDLLTEYAKEIQDPTNRKKYEDEIKQMEAEQGNNVKFVTPDPGFVVKTLLKSTGQKVFINICESATIEEPQKKIVTRNGQTGTNWSVPHSLTKHREDTDKEGKMCIVYDVVFNPKALRLAKMDKAIKDMLIKTATDGIQRAFPHHELDTSVLKFPKMKFKGSVHKSLIREKSDSGDGGDKGTSTVAAGKKAIADLAQELQRSHGSGTTSTSPNSRSNSNKGVAETTPAESNINQSTPKYTITQRGEFDMLDYCNGAQKHSSQVAKRPKELVIKIELPKCTSAAGVDLDLAEDRLALTSEQGPYKLNTKLPYPVDEDEGIATFDKATRTLKVIVPVLKPQPSPSNYATVTTTDGATASTTEDISHQTSQNHITKEKDDGDTEPKSQGVDSHDGEEELVIADVSQDSGGTQVKKEGDEEVKFSFHQSKDTVTVIINTPKINEKSLSMDFVEHTFGPIGVHVCNISFGFEQDSFEFVNHLVLRFDTMVLDSETTTDVSKENAVIVFKKTDPIFWRRIQAGNSDDSLEEHLFPTLENNNTAARDEPEDDWSRDDVEIVSSVCKGDKDEIEVQVQSKPKLKKGSRVSFQLPEESPEEGHAITKQTEETNMHGGDIDETFSSFVPTDSFQGKRQGYVFKRDSLGLGYYKDQSQEQYSEALPGLVKAFSQSNTNNTTDSVESSSLVAATTEEEEKGYGGLADARLKLNEEQNPTMDVESPRKLPPKAPQEAPAMSLRNDLLDELD